MPIYEYRCGKCGHEFEELVRGSEKELKCAKCGAGGAARKMSRFAAVVKSGGCARREECPSAGRSCGAGGACGHQH
jgi:putative FmdB family regulatory protein